jgi:hypothetical protein
MMKEPQGPFSTNNILDPSDPELQEYLRLSWVPKQPRKRYQRKRYQRRKDALWNWMVPPFAYAPIPSSTPPLALWAWEECKQFPQH